MWEVRSGIQYVFKLLYLGFVPVLPLSYLGFACSLRGRAVSVTGPSCGSFESSGTAGSRCRATGAMYRSTEGPIPHVQAHRHAAPMCGACDSSVTACAYVPCITPIRPDPDRSVELIHTADLAAGGLFSYSRCETEKRFRPKWNEATPSGVPSQEHATAAPGLRMGRSTLVGARVEDRLVLLLLARSVLGLARLDSVGGHLCDARLRVAAASAPISTCIRARIGVSGREWGLHRALKPSM